MAARNDGHRGTRCQSLLHICRFCSTDRNWRRLAPEPRSSPRALCTLPASNLTPHGHTIECPLTSWARHVSVWCSEGGGTHNMLTDILSSGTKRIPTAPQCVNHLMDPCSRLLRLPFTSSESVTRVTPRGTVHQERQVLVSTLSAIAPHSTKHELTSTTPRPALNEMMIATPAITNGARHITVRTHAGTG
jgi:hypothetical protein